MKNSTGRWNKHATDSDMPAYACVKSSVVWLRENLRVNVLGGYLDSMEQDKTFLGTEPIGKLLMKLAVPTVIAQLVNMLYNIIDRVYIGHIPGEGSMALTGVGVCMPLILIIAAFAALVGSGGSPRASIYMGKGEHDTAEKILTGCLSLQIIVSIILTVILLIWNENLLLMFGASENTISYATAYMNIYAIGTIFVQITLGMNTFITAQGKAITGMMTVLIGAVANIILDPIFIFGMHMGVRGAALATVISQALSCIWVLSFLSGKKTLLRIKKENIMPGLQLVPPCVALGASMFVMQASESVISVCFNSSLLKYGGDIAVGAMTILTSVMHRPGGAADHQLQLWCKKFVQSKAELQNTALRLCHLFHCSVGNHYGISTGICKIVYHRCCTDRFYGKGTSDLLSCIVRVRYTDRLPDDLCVYRKCAVLHYCGNPAEIYIVDSIDLHITACYGK